MDNSFGGAFLDPPDPSTFHTRAYSVSHGLKRMQPSNDSDSHALYSQPPCGYCVRKGKIRAALDRRAIQEVTEVVIKKKKEERRVYSLINCAPAVSSTFVFHRPFRESLSKRRDLELETFFRVQRSLDRADEEGTHRGARRLCKRTYKFEKGEGG